MKYCAKCGAPLNRQGVCTNYLQCNYTASNAFENWEMTSTVTSDLRTNLLLVDMLVGKSNFDYTPTFYVLGGAAVVLQGIRNRYTIDIDTANKLREEVKAVVGEFINDNASEVALLARNYENRAVRFMEDELHNIRVFLLSKEDLLISKAITDRKKDKKDVVNGHLLDKRTVSKAVSILETEFDARVAGVVKRMLDELVENELDYLDEND